MSRLSDLAYRLRTLLTRRHRERELNDEVSFHLAMDEATFASTFHRFAGAAA